MKETTDIVPKIEKAIQKKMPDAVILKHNDMSTKGIPDLAITYAGRTNYVEVKLLKKDETPSSFKKHFIPLQLATAILLQRQGHAYYFVAYPLAGQLHAAIFSPTAVKTFLDDKLFDGPSSFTSSGLVLFDGFMDHALDFLTEEVRG